MIIMSTVMRKEIQIFQFMRHVVDIENTFPQLQPVGISRIKSQIERSSRRINNHHHSSNSIISHIFFLVWGSKTRRKKENYKKKKKHYLVQIIAK